MSHNPEQYEEDLNAVSKHYDKNERLSWKRKEKKMQSIIENKLQPIQDEMLKLIAKKQPIIDEIEKLRAVMVKECIHPKEHLVHKGNFVECKFCNRKLRVNTTNHE